MTPNIVAVLVKTCKGLDESERSAIESRVPTDQKEEENRRVDWRRRTYKKDGATNTTYNIHGPVETLSAWVAANSPRPCGLQQHVHVLADRRSAPRASGGVMSSPPAAVRARVATIQIVRREPQASPSRLEPSVEIPRGGLMSQEMRVVGLPESDCSENDVTVSGLPASTIVRLCGP